MYDEYIRKYTKLYSGKEPELKEGDIFRIMVPLDDSYSYDFGQDATNATKDATNYELNDDEKKICFLLKRNQQLPRKSFMNSLMFR